MDVVQKQTITKTNIALACLFRWPLHPDNLCYCATRRFLWMPHQDELCDLPHTAATLLLAEFPWLPHRDSVCHFLDLITTKLGYEVPVVSPMGRFV